MEKSTHKVEVTSVTMRPHPNANTLSIVDVFGYQVCVRTADWHTGDLGAYIPPDSVVPDSPLFAFLDGHLRIKARKLRGVVSFGLLVPAPAGSKVGDDVAEVLGVIHYEPPLPLSSGGETEKPPPGFVGGKYDIDALRRFNRVFVPGELVMITEKLHGASARFAFSGGRMYCGSRGEWKKESDTSLWWQALRVTPTLQAFCERYPGLTVYGEVYGAVQSLRYGLGPGRVAFAAFDVARPNGTWIDAPESRLQLRSCDVPLVPLLADKMPFEFEAVVAMAEGPSVVPGAKHVREGCVVKPLVERWNEEIGRVCLKVVGAGYLEKS